MKIPDIIKKIGSAVLREAVPGGGLILSAINEFLPDDKKLPNTATGTDINSAISNLPPDKQAEILGKEFDVEITQIKESYSTVRAMLESDAKTPHTTRPRIALGAFYTVAWVDGAVIAAWLYGVVMKDEALVTSIMNGWPFVLAVIAPLVTLLMAYFGVLKQEHKNRMNAANGEVTPSGITGIISTILRR